MAMDAAIFSRGNKVYLVIHPFVLFKRIIEQVTAPYGLVITKPYLW